MLTHEGPIPTSGRAHASASSYPGKFRNPFAEDNNRITRGMAWKKFGRISGGYANPLPLWRGRGLLGNLHPENQLYDKLLIYSI